MKVKKEKKSDICFGESRLVWAKLKYCTFWPARLAFAPPEISQKMKQSASKKTCVLFFGTKNYGFVTKNNIVDYVENRERFVTKYKNSGFVNAVRQADDFVRDPIKFASNGCIKIANNTLTVKQEIDGNIKTENDMNVPFTSENVECLDVGKQLQSLQDEKNKMIQDILSLKSEIQKLHFEMLNKDREIEKNRTGSESRIEQLNLEVSEWKTKFQLEQKKQIENLNNKDREIEIIRTATKSQIELLTSEVSEWKIKFEKNQKMQFGNVNSISRLSREKNVLSAKVKQLERYSGTGGESKIDTNDEEYEVEKIMKHKFVSGHRHFFIKWKNYSAKHNSWVNEQNLHCSSLLNQYLKSKKLL